MIAGIIIIMYTLALVGAGYFYLIKRYRLSFADGIRPVIRNNIKFIILTLVLLILFFVNTLRYLDRAGASMCPLILRWTTLIWGVFLLARVDFKEQKIPNMIILIMLMARIGFLVYEAVTNDGYINMVLTPPVLGALAGAAVMVLGLLISRKGIGMGDIKFFIVIGFFVGSTYIIPAMFYTFLSSAVVGIVMLLTKKANLKDFIPMAPFAFVGIVTEYVFLTIGG